MALTDAQVAAMFEDTPPDTPMPEATAGVSMFDDLPRLDKQAEYDKQKAIEGQVPEKDFWDRTVDTYMATQSAAWGDMTDPNRDPAAKTQGMIAAGVTGVSNVLMDGGLTMLDTLVPDVVQDAVKDYSREKWEAVASNPVMKTGLEVLGQGWDAYQEWAEEHPDESERLAEVLELGSLGRTPSAMKTPRGATIKAHAYRSVKNKRVRQTQKSLEPAMGTGDGHYEIDKSTLLNKRIYKPSPYEIQVAEQMAKTKGFNPNASSTENMNVAWKEARKIANELEAKLAKVDKPINVQSIKQGLANKVNNLADETLLVGNSLEKAIKIYGQAEKLLDASDGTALGLLKVRRQLDKWVRDQNKGVFDSDSINGTKVALKEIRDYLNKKTGDTLPGEYVSNSLAKQSKLLRAGDGYQAKMFKEADTSIGRLRQDVENAVGTKFPSTPLAAGATVGVAAAVVGASPVAATGIALLAANYKGAAWLASPEGRLMLARAVKETQMFPAYRPEINALIQIAENLEPEEETE